MTQNHLSDAVTASVPVDWLHLFIGHRVWSKPESMGHSSYGYYVLVDVVHEETGSRYYPIRIKAVIDYQNERHEVNTPQSCTVQDVPAGECEAIEYDGKTWWEWIPQHRTAPTDSGDQFMLM